MTALETYVKDKKRQEYIKKVRAKINKLGIEYSIISLSLLLEELLVKVFQLITGKVLRTKASN